MSKDSGIEWTDHTFNPWWGCVKVSPGCQHCYAEGFANRYGHKVWGPASTTARRTFGAKHWDEPRKWNASAAKAGKRERVFCASMADVFEDHPMAANERPKLWRLIEETPMLDWLLLTKRPGNIWSMLPDDWLVSPRLNVWLGTSAENQEQANKRIPELLDIPAWVYFVSAEPLLESVSLKPLFDGPYGQIDWVIVGGESGPGARPMNLDWARTIRDDCQSEGAAFFMKQLGSQGRGRDKGGKLEDMPEDLRIRDIPVFHPGDVAEFVDEEEARHDTPA